MAGKVFLTFDDGPGPKTIELAEMLNRLGVKATFFLVGENIKRFPEAVRAINSLGHEIGVHALSHKPLRNLSQVETAKEIEETIALIKQVSGVTPKTYRAAHGYLTPATLAIMKKNGLRHIDWSNDTLDWRTAMQNSRLNAEAIAKSIKKGDVVLFHDGAAREHAKFETARGENLLQAMPIIVGALKKRGLDFERISNPQTGRMQKGKRFGYHLRTISKYARARAKAILPKRIARRI